MTKAPYLFLSAAICLFLVSTLTLLYGQTAEELKSLNTGIDEAVVKKDIKLLEKFYGDSFVFVHGTGQIDSKASWIANVARPQQQFISRTHDSVRVEFHPGLALVTGKLRVKRKDAGKVEPVAYGLVYMRIFAGRKGRWQLVSHRTIREWHE